MEDFLPTPDTCTICVEILAKVFNIFHTRITVHLFRETINQIENRTQCWGSMAFGADPDPDLDPRSRNFD